MSAHHCYFAVQGFDMWGADIHQMRWIKDYEQCVQIAKQRINFNERLCGVIFRQDNGTFSIFIKPSEDANPTTNLTDWHRCTNIFYGKKMIINEYNKESDVTRQILMNKGLQHFIANVDMWDGNLETKFFSNFKEAYFNAVQMVNLDSSRCATVVDVWEDHQWAVYLKDPRKTNPLKSACHKKCQTIFVGKKI